MTKIKKSDVEVVRHCSGSDCELGKLCFTCPNCGEYQIHTGDGWWYSQGYEGYDSAIECEDCDAKLNLEREDHYSDWEVVCKLGENDEKTP